ncbi:MAG TPA: hypothetical protein VFA14_00605 [Herbaspirillum sp.]|nr:hypothetical protein [Herbaspirillum sp.]
MTIFTLFFHAAPGTRTRNRAIAGISLSILMHALLFFVLRSALQQVHVQADSSHEPLEVVFVQPRPTPPSPAVRQAGKSEPPPRIPSRLKPSPVAVPPEVDISTMLDAARERRRAAEDAAVRENAQARGLSANEIAHANMALQERKASGMFEIISKGPRVAQYVFRSWTADAHHSQRQTITVDVGPDGDVEKAIVDSMITLIRKYYSGDFNWDSRRLGRMVSLSARQEDTAGLRTFLLHEFFD